MENKVYYPRIGNNIYVSIDKHWFYYVRLVYSYSGNTPEARNILKRIKRIFIYEENRCKKMLHNQISQMPIYKSDTLLTFMFDWSDQIKRAKGRKKELLCESVTTELLHYTELRIINNK